MDRRKLAYHLRRYILVTQGREPPSQSTPVNTPCEKSLNNRTTTEDDSYPERRPSSNSDVKNLEAQSELRELEEESQDCVKCDLSRHRKNVVFGQGTVSARVFVIGEGPGAQEDEEGLPFVGKAGKLLRSGFERVGLKEEELYITNTVKCRPPGNRDPAADELESCRPYLDKQIDLVQPEVILALGSFAIKYCLGEKKGVAESRGDVHEWQQKQLVATYHPAYVLRNQSKAQAFMNDLKRSRELLRT